MHRVPRENTIDCFPLRLEAALFLVADTAAAAEVRLADDVGAALFRLDQAVETEPVIVVLLFVVRLAVAFVVAPVAVSGCSILVNDDVSLL